MIGVVQIHPEAPLDPKPIVFDILTEFSNPLMWIVSNEYLDPILSINRSFRLLLIPNFVVFSISF